MDAHDEQMRAFYAVDLPERVNRPLDPRRLAAADAFAGACAARGLKTVLEVGCGAGRDGELLAARGLTYTGIDLSPVGVDLCRSRGLAAEVASATQLPFPDDTFDAGWTMSTLMHLAGDDAETALAELVRVIRAGGLLEVGVWGAATTGVHHDEHGRLFNHRDDDTWRHLLGSYGHLEAYDTWNHLPGGGHYQWARLRVL